ncbi:MAG: hypothetical protein KAK00_00280 [Nanoarchaeota archaeon]|nr:hypothetical protein [Nanoarchaeota archaeon]
MAQKDKEVISFNIDSDAVEKLKQIVPKNKLSKRINQLILDNIELHSDLILESDYIMHLKKKLGIMSIELKEKTKLYRKLDVELPVLKEDINHVLSQIEKQRDIENKNKIESDK